MKWKLILMLALMSASTTSCSLGDDDAVMIRLEPIAVTSVELPDPFVFGESNDIIVKYNNPSNCHRFKGFQAENRQNTWEFTVVTEFFNSPDCMEENLPTEQTLPFTPDSTGTYVFRFFSGFDAAGQPEYLEYSVDVVE